MTVRATVYGIERVDWNEDHVGLRIKNMRCTVHPTYRAIQKPTATCASCRFIWDRKG